jgi:hypothetical protein
MKKEQWIEEVLQTAKTIGAVESNPYMATRIEGKLQQKRIPEIPLRWVYATVAAMLIILFVNISAWTIANVSNEQNTAVQQLVREYGWASHDIYSASSN